MCSFKLNQTNQIIDSILTRKHETDPLACFINTRNLTRSIVDCEYQHLFIVSDLSSGLKHVTQTPIATAIILTLTRCMKQLDHYVHVHTYDPYINMFIKNARTGDLIEKIELHDALYLLDGVHKTDEEYSIFLDMEMALNEFISQIKLELFSPWFKNLEYNARRVKDKNFMALPYFAG